jgi:predicted amidohydrolase YtcJ
MKELPHEGAALRFSVARRVYGRSRGSVTLVVAFLATTLGLAAQNPVLPADLVLVDGRILTVDEGFREATALAVRDGRFIAVGSNEDARRYIGRNTRVIDGRGRTVVPGLIDTHVHALDVAAAEAVQPFRSLPSVGALQAWIRGETGRRPRDAWIWTPRVYPTRLSEHRFPTRQELDAAAPDHPVAVDGAYAFVLNTAALRTAGITRNSPDPSGGAIVKDAAGEPTGLLRNVGSLLDRFRSRSGGLSLNILEQIHRQYLSVGITSVIERGASLDGYKVYEALRHSDRLHVRATVTIRIPHPENRAEVERFIGELPFRSGAKPGNSPRPASDGDEWLKPGPLKIVADGGILIGTSFMRQPYGLSSRELYAVDDPRYRGFLTLTPEQIAAAIAIGHRHGWQMVVHVTGDAGVDVVLDAIEAAQKEQPGLDRRHTLLHAYFVNRETAARAARLGVLVDTQPAWHYEDADALSKALGRERLAHFIGLRTWREAGVDVAINTDHMFGLDPNESLNPFNPFLTMYSATTRRTEAGQVVGGDEAVSRQEALRMMTSMAARFSFDEKNRGSIETGKLGDFVVLNEHLLTVPPERMREIRPDLTVVGGRVAFERGAGR